MERLHWQGSHIQGRQGLNPYYNGRYSWRVKNVAESAQAQGLNPYYNGRYSWSAQAQATAPEVTPVLILIIMEDTHGGYRGTVFGTLCSLNPYYNGRYSWSLCTN